MLQRRTAQIALTLARFFRMVDLRRGQEERRAGALWMTSMGGGQVIRSETRTPKTYSSPFRHTLINAVVDVVLEDLRLVLLTNAMNTRHCLNFERRVQERLDQKHLRAKRVS